MNPTTKILALLLVSANTAWAHNGQVTLAASLSEMVLDGEWADWSQEIPWQTISHTAYGNRLDGPQDYAGRVRIGYDAAINALYLAVEVADESAVIDTVRPSNWDTQDGCEVYLDLQHGEGDARQFAVYGNWTMGAHSSVAVLRGAGFHRYEWRIDLEPLGGRLVVGEVVGVDVAVGDRDVDGSFSWIAWGRGANKVQRAGRRGDLILQGSDLDLGQLRGQVRGGGSLGEPRGTVRVEGADAWRIDVAVDAQGNYSVIVPQGRYRLAWQQRGEVGTAVEVELVAGDVREVELAATVGPLGRSVVAGAGRTLAIGHGTRRGEWLHYGVADGLPATIILDVIEDRQKHLWFGTFAGGVCRFDGRELCVFGERDGLPSNKVQSILEDRAGRMWFGSGWLRTEGAGVSVLHGGQITTYTVDDGLAHNSVLCMLEDRSGTLWFGTWEGVSAWDGERFTTFRVEDGLADNVVESIAQDAQGHLWFGTGYGNSGGLSGGLSRFDGQRWTTFSTRDGLPSNWVTSVLVRDGDLWVGTLGGGVARFDGERFTAFTAVDGLSGNRVWSLVEDEIGDVWAAGGGGLSHWDGERWIALGVADQAEGQEAYVLHSARDGSIWMGFSSGLHRYDGKRLVNFSTREGLAHNGVISMLQDREGQVWLGTVGGVSRWDGKRFTTYTTADGLVHDSVLSMLEDRQGAIWFGTRVGLSRYDGREWASFTTAEGLVHDYVQRMLEDSRGHLWVGTRGGVSRYDGRQWTNFTTAEGLAHNRVVDLLEDKKGHMWFRTAGGLSRYDGGEMVSLAELDGAVGSQISMMFVDRAGQVWFGSERGMSRYDGASFEVLATSDQLGGNIHSAFETRAGHIWFCGRTGVSRWDGEQFTTYTAADGLAYDNVWHGFEDREGTLWFGTAGGGVSRYDGKVFQSLIQRDGLTSDRVSGLLQDDEGAVWIATAVGVTRYLSHRGAPSVRVIDVVADRHYGAVASIAVSSLQDLLAFEFRSAAYHTRPGSMVYRYRLLGRDEDWQVTRLERVEYHDLPRGRYTFEVEAVDRDLNYSPASTRVAVEVHLPYERIAWIGTLALAALLIVWQAGRLVQRDKRLQGSNVELRSEIAERQRVEAERQRLDEQLVQMRYLERLHAALERAHSLEEVAQQTCAVLDAMLETLPRSGVRFDCDGRTWSRGVAELEHHYQRVLQWGDRERGLLHLFSDMALSEGQERMLVNETVAQVTRRLEALELMAQLLQSARLVSLGEMAAGVAHELNQPLAAISTVAGDVYLRIVEDGVVGEQQLKEMMRDIAGLVERMAATIDHLRVFSRDQSDEPGVAFDLNEVVHSGLKVIGTQLKNHGIAVELELAKGLPKVFGHPYQLEQVLLNLLANARDAIDERDGAKRIWVRTRYELPTATRRHGMVICEVEDSGAGIAELDRARIFEPFFTTKEADRGTGLGLSISYAIVRNHKGQITCESGLGAGTTFRVSLPVEA